MKNATIKHIIKNKKLLFQIIFFGIIFLYLLSYSPAITYKLLHTNNPKTKDTIIVYDTVFVYDTVYVYETVYDTVFQYDTVVVQEPKHKNDSIKIYDNSLQVFSDEIWQKTEDKKTKKEFREFKPEFSTELFAAANTVKYAYSKQNSVVTDADFLLLKNTFTPKSEFNAGMNINMNIKHLQFQTGFAYSVFNENFKQKTAQTKVDSTNWYQYFETPDYQVDTIQFLNLDSLLHGDTVWVAYYDSILINKIDSTLHTKYDTTKILRENTTVNTYHYLDIPLVMGYQFQFTNFNFTIKSGILLSYYLFSKGNLYDNSQQIIESKSAIKTQINYSLLFSLQALYKLNDYSGIYFEPIYRHSFNSILNQYKIQQTPNTLGIRAGFYWKF